MLHEMSNKAFLRLLALVITLIVSIGLLWSAWPILNTVDRWIGAAFLLVILLTGVYFIIHAVLTIMEHHEAVAAKKQARRLEAERHAHQLRIEAERTSTESLLTQRRFELEMRRFDIESHLSLTRIEATQYGYAALVERSTDGYSITHVPTPQLASPANANTTKKQSAATWGDEAPQAPLRIPTFAESLATGNVGPDQRDMLFCYQLLEDEDTGRIQVIPLRGEIGEMHTQFVAGGSQSGKTTYMAGMIAQAAAMGALFYIVDPHKMHPEKSIAAKVAAYSDRFILPPAASHAEIAALLKHATKLRDDRIAGKPTPYDGHHIMIVVDEVPALMAYQRSSDKALKQLYVDLALFMQSIGTQTAKFGVTGLFGSQFTTKDELGEIEIRDACMSQLILRLHPTQAQAMRVLGSARVEEIKRMPKGQGFLMLANSFEPVRVASGNVTPGDLEQLASMLPPSPLSKIGRNQMRNQVTDSTVIPFPGTVITEGENGLKVDRNEVGNQIDTALQAKVSKVLELLGQNKSDIIYAVWGVRPGKSEAYQTALAEYDEVMSIIRDMAKEKVV